VIKDSQKALLTELVKLQAEANTAANTPRPTQPFWTPKGDMSDYLTYKSFTNKFEYFVAKIHNNVDRLTLLLTLFKGNAYDMIKNLMLEDPNCKVATDKLKHSI